VSLPIHGRRILVSRPRISYELCVSQAFVSRSCLWGRDSGRTTLAVSFPLRPRNVNGTMTLTNRALNVQQGDLQQ
jgi:hypothetical protein